MAFPRRFPILGFAPSALLALSLLLPAAPAPAAPAPAADPAAMDAVRDLLRAGDRAKALEGARALLAADGAVVEAHVLYQDAARGQVPRPILIKEYESRMAKSPGGDSSFLLARLQSPVEAEKTLKEGLKGDAKSYWIQV
ncbi:MAG: hypothetical protein L6R43_19065, partial [Planctomycetes bacterium]|nr:hypothetical protein [Planctomycetota bacterium]